MNVPPKKTVSVKKTFSSKSKQVKQECDSIHQKAGPKQCCGFIVGKGILVFWITLVFSNL